MSKANSLYTDDYFVSRDGSDRDRATSMQQEIRFLAKNTNIDLAIATICDIGCATGELYDAMNRPANYYGFDVNNNALDIAKAKGVNVIASPFGMTKAFDLVIYRGTIQHVDNPFTMIEDSFSILKPGGYIAFLATPNASSICYRLFQDLPALNPRLNLYIPSSLTLSNILKIYGFESVVIDYPYLNSPYARPVRDHLHFLARLFLLSSKVPTFWGNMMNIVAQAPL